MLKRRKMVKIYLSFAIITSCMLMTSCGGSYNAPKTYTEYENTTVTTTVQTKATTTETKKKTYSISESKAKQLAKDIIEKNMTVSFPVTDYVFFGDIKFYSDMNNNNVRWGTVDVHGHYYKTDKYGNSGSKVNFTKTIYIDKENQKASFTHYY